MTFLQPKYKQPFFSRTISHPLSPDDYSYFLSVHTFARFRLLFYGLHSKPKKVSPEHQKESTHSPQSAEEALFGANARNSTQNTMYKIGKKTAKLQP